jgi:hypothetical protein
MPDTTGEPFPGVAAWAARYKACWEILPLQEVDPHGARMQVGYELTLLAQPGTHGPLDESSPEIVDLIDKLQLIGRRVLPEDERSSEFELSPFDWAQHMRSETDWAPEIQLTLRIFNKGEYFAPPDADEDHAVKEMEVRLGRYGLRRGSWKEGA